jgi:hypothetical protein
MDNPLFRLQRPSVNLRLKGLFLAFFCEFILFVLTVFRFGEWLLFMQQPFCTDALMDFLGGNGMFIWRFSFVVLIKYITAFWNGSLFLSLILAFLCVLVLCLKNSYYVWF